MSTPYGRRVAGWLANRDILPTSGRALLSYYAETGDFDIETIRLQRLVEQRTEAMIGDVFAPVEDALAEEFDEPSVSLSYDTKLTMPAELTLGQTYRMARERAHTGKDPVVDSVWSEDSPDTQISGEEDNHPIPFPRSVGDVEWNSEPDTPAEFVDRSEYITRVSIAALIDGDMRDAINDEEFEDFEVSIDVSPDERRRVAEIAQETIESRLQTAFDCLPEDVQEVYEWAVELSERHQDRDPYFRDLYESALDGDEDARERIRTEYRNGSLSDLESDISMFEEIDNLAYLKTQYARVGVIYDGMIEMYRNAGIPIGEQFKRSIILSIIGAQIWLDDLDDFEADRAETQLTPVTVEYLLTEYDRVAYEQVRAITERYLDLAREYAMESDSPLTGIAVEYIYHSGDPSVLPT